MSDPSPIADSPSPDLVLERSLFWGVLWAMALYGVDVFMYAYSSEMFWTSSSSTRRNRKFYIIYGGILLALLSIGTFTDAVFVQFMWIDHRDAPGGPIGYLAANQTVWWQVLGTAASQFTNFFADGLLVYRCYIIWNARWKVIVLPSLIYLASIGVAMVMLAQTAQPNNNFFRGKTVNYTVVWVALSVSLNILVTSAIVFRILRVRNMCKKQLSGNTSMLATYTGISAVLIESALPFSIIGIIAAVTYGKNLDYGPGFIFIWGSFSALSPQFIIFRVARGRAWTDATAATVSSLGFSETKDSVQMKTIVVSRTDVDQLGQKKSAGSLGNV
ncbi:hypothetical protein C8J56DRAFT_1172590 [Mycena floridula]|nr:hypothetical protein C8J56DRAFT_1172590 [Mycena floridula]